ncbi:MAG: hypothetical protein HY420_00545 [Candidatus Kerfeldbacteria bacterium]|nr:hypothetical protein [Candidatus Kerfeldbacteria bacterium]
MIKPRGDWPRELSSVEHQKIRQALEHYRTTRSPQEHVTLDSEFENAVATLEVEEGSLTTDHQEAVRQAVRHYLENDWQTGKNGNLPRHQTGHFHLTIIPIYHRM